MAITITQGSYLPTALSTLATLVTDTSGPKIVKFDIDTTWLPATGLLNLSFQTAPDATTQFTEVENITISNPVTLYQSNATASMTSGSGVLTLTSAFGTALIVGQRVVVVGAGAGGANLDTFVTVVTSTTSYTLSANAGTTVSAANCYAGPPNEGNGSEPQFESVVFSAPYGFQVVAQVISGTLPPIALRWFETAAA